MPVKSKPEASQGDILFSGPPRRLIAMGEVPDLSGVEFRPGGPLKAHLPERGHALRLRNNTRRGISSAKLKLSPNTPPGQYKGQLVGKDQSWDALITVQPNVSVSIAPAELTFSAQPGKRALFVATLRNLGNVDVTIPKAAPIGIFDDDGVETAFASTYGKKFEDVNDFFSNFIGKLNEAHGGLMKLTLVKGAGAHPPGATVLLEIGADIPAEARKGHRYHGVWTTDFANLAVSIFVEK